MADGDPPPTSAYADVVDKLGTIAAPLLGGFSITLIGLVASKDASATIRWPAWVLCTLIAAAVLFLLAVQWTIAGRQFFLTPEEHAAQSPQAPEETRRQSYAAAMGDFRAWATRARIAFDAGLAALLLGLAEVALPPGKVAHFGFARSLAVVIALVAFAGEVLSLVQDEWRTAQWNRRIRRTRPAATRPERGARASVSADDQRGKFEISARGSGSRERTTSVRPAESTEAGGAAPLQPPRRQDTPQANASLSGGSEESARPPPLHMSEALGDAHAHAAFQARGNASGIGVSVTRAYHEGADRAWECLVSDGHKWHYIRLIGDKVGQYPNISPVDVEEGISQFAESLPKVGRLRHLLNMNPLHISRHGIVNR